MNSSGETTAAARERSEALAEILAQRILVLDGATGTWLQGENLTAMDFGGEAYEGCNEHLVLTRPDVVRRMHESYLAAGADMVETDTFGGTPLVLAEYGLAERAFEINAQAAGLARQAAAKFSTPERPRFVAGSMGPTTRSVTVTGGITFDELIGKLRARRNSARSACSEGNIPLPLQRERPRPRLCRDLARGVRVGDLNPSP